MFLRAQFSSQIASIADFALTILLTKVLSLYYVYATFLGSTFGGIINCVINYKWTFRSKECKKRNVAFKYMIVWIGSIILNTYGVYLTTEFMKKQPFVSDMLGRFVDDIFLFSKVVVSLIVGLIWNYNMQRIFVYRNINIRRYLPRKDKKSFKGTLN